MNYAKEIREAEKLEARSIKEWKENGTTEEAIKVLKMQKDKKRNNTILGLVYTAAWAGLMIYINQKEKTERKQIADEKAVENTRIADIDEAYELALAENETRKYIEEYVDNNMVEAAVSVEE